MKFFKYVILLIISVPAFLHAEGGSVYSRLGAGDLFYSYSARRMGLGGLGVAVFDRDFLGTINPASWTRLEMTRFEVALNFQNFKEQSTVQSGFHSLTNFSGATIGVPVERDLGISIVGGYVPYSNVNYSVVENNSTSIYPNKTTYEGTGSLTKAFLGASYKLPFDVSIGATFDYYIGKSDYYSKAEFINEPTNHDAWYQSAYKTAGIGGSFGLISNDFAKTFGLTSISDLRFGLAMNLASNFNADTNYVLYNSRGVDTVAMGKTNSQLPVRFVAGLNFTYKNAYLVTLDYLYQPWNEYKFGNQSSANLRAAQKVSAGVEYRNPDNRASGFFERTMLRGGLSYEQTQYQVNGQGINEYAVYAGVSFPLEYGNTIDFALQYGVRGTTDMNLIKENIFRANVSMSLGELWFLRPQR